MRLYLVRWPLGCCSLVSAEDENDLFGILDQSEDPSQCRWREYDGPVWIDFDLPMHRRGDNARRIGRAEWPRTPPSARDLPVVGDEHTRYCAARIAADGLREAVRIRRDPAAEESGDMLRQIAEFAWPRTAGVDHDADQREDGGYPSVSDVVEALRQDIDQHVGSDAAASACGRWYENIFRDLDGRPPVPAPDAEPDDEDEDDESPVPSLPPAAEKSPHSVVYVLRGANDGLVKIGTTVNLRERLKAIRAMSAIEVELLACFPGTAHEERELHRRFAKLRRRGEWFEPAPELLEWVEKFRWGLR